MIRRHESTALDPVERAARRAIRRLGEEAVHLAWARIQALGTIGDRSARARRFGSFGAGSCIGFPCVLVGEQAIHIGRDAMIAADTTVTAGWVVEGWTLPDVVVRIGDRSLIGGGSTVIGHRLIDIGDDVWTGRNVHITDMNHGFSDVDRPISEQWQGPDPVHIGDGSWLGHGVVVLPGARIGRHVAVGANSVVIGTLPDRCVAVGAPARVVRRHDTERGWLAVAWDGSETPDDPDRHQLERLARELDATDPSEREAVARLAAELRSGSASAHRRS